MDRGICEPVTMTVLFRFRRKKDRAELVNAIVSVPCNTTKLSYSW